MLSKQTIERIDKEADDFGFQVPYNGTNDFYNMDKVNSYKAGATAEATRHEQERKELVDFIKQVDKSLYVGEDLNDKEILQWYIEVCKTIKEEAKATLLKYKTQ